MAKSAFRQSPSGRALFTPGPGARMRLVEATATVGAVSVPIPVAAGFAGAAILPLSVVMSDFNPLLQYRATIICDVLNPTTNATGNVQMFLQASTDGGVTQVELASNAHTLIGKQDGGQARQMRCDLPLTSGALLGLPAGSNVLVTAKIGAQAGGGTMTVISTAVADAKTRGTMLLQLEECL